MNYNNQYIYDIPLINNIIKSYVKNEKHDKVINEINVISLLIIIINVDITFIESCTLLKHIISI